MAQCTVRKQMIMDPLQAIFVQGWGMKQLVACVNLHIIVCTAQLPSHKSLRYPNMAYKLSYEVDGVKLHEGT